MISYIEFSQVLLQLVFTFIMLDYFAAIFFPFVWIVVRLFISDWMQIQWSAVAPNDKETQNHMSRFNLRLDLESEFVFWFEVLYKEVLYMFCFICWVHKNRNAHGLKWYHMKTSQWFLFIMWMISYIHICWYRASFAPTNQQRVTFFILSKCQLSKYDSYEERARLFFSFVSYEYSHI